MNSAKASNYLISEYSTTHCSFPRPSPCPVYAGETWRRNKRENGRGETPKELLKGTSTTANYDMEIFKGISLIEIMEKYLAAEKGKASLRREYMSFQNEHKKELKSIKEDQRKRDADSQTMKKEIGALKDKIKAIEEEHKAELRNVAENQQEKEAEILRMQNEIVGLKETVASRDEKIKSLKLPRRFATARDETNSRPWLPGIADLHVRLIRRTWKAQAIHFFPGGTQAELRNVAENQQEKEAEILRMQNEIVGLKETVASRDEKIKSLERGARAAFGRARDSEVPAQDTDRGPFQERRQEERRGRETQAAGENKEQDTAVSALQDTIKLLQEQSTKELLSLRNAQHLKEAEAASQLREAQEALKSRDKRVKTLKRQLKEKEAECGRLSSVLEEKEIQVSQLEGQLEIHERKVRTLQSRLDDKENQLHELQSRWMLLSARTRLCLGHTTVSQAGGSPHGQRGGRSLRKQQHHKRSSQAESRGRNRASGPEEGRKSKDPQATKRTKTPQADTLRESPQAVTSQAEAGRRGKRRPIERPEAPQAQSEDETPEGGSECESCASSQAESDDASP
ncbi:hypothetical protein C7M84_024984 [Penaeus vannamei]|uniref:Uncharacterized protein n=1 Tax=Penaeus vannamei TaxID=6689 RepID=A0A3R7SYM5_PENVA|nr:hypothetical protein C7M84_024984 [Penaeus vannamei]